MQQRIILILCFLIGISVWTLIMTKKYKTDKCELEGSYGENDQNTKNSGLKEAQQLILEITRLKIKLELLHYNFKDSDVTKLEDLLMNYGGTPRRSLVVSSWRSGSSFLGDMVNVMSSNFYHYEPLLKYGITRIRGPPYSDEALLYIKSLFQCDRDAMKTYIHYWKNNSHTAMFRTFNPIQNNRRLWNMCEIKDEFCSNSDLVSMICMLFPFQSMKVVRFRLSLAKDILEDKKLNVKVVLLIRDPRAVMEARYRFEPFCATPDCMDPEILCGDMVNDHVTAQQFSRKYPKQFMVVRYEELMMNINVIGLHVVRFLRLGPARSFREYLKRNGDIGLQINERSAFKWLTDLKFNSVAKIQEKCKEAMQLWDYQMALNASHMASKHFHPLTTHSVFPMPMEDDDFDGEFNM